MPLLELPLLTSLRDEFRLSMRRLLSDLCRDLEQSYGDIAKSFQLSTGHFRFLAQSLKQPAYSNWKIVGWIESLNDLVYFIDLLQQVQREEDRREFAAQLFAECEEKFFEHSYLDELFPSGKPQAGGLESRLRWLCQRLSQEVVQEALCVNPQAAMAWCATQPARSWSVVGQLTQNFERAEPSGTLFVDEWGTGYGATPEVRKALQACNDRVTFDIGPRNIDLIIGTYRGALCAAWGESLVWRWDQQFPPVAADRPQGPLTVGPTLVYGRDKQPHRVVRTELKQVERIGRAWRTIQQAWPEGHEVLSLLTSRIVPLKAKGVVSFSYRHRPGLSFINCFDRDNLDLIDDLIHENSHHHLNLLLRKHVLYHRDRNQQIFYSPWRRSLRPVRGILHATFTFTMGAMLFEQLSRWASGRGGLARWKREGLIQRDLQRARFRCLEEMESVRYSIQDLEYAGWHLKWLTGSGQRLVKQLAETIEQIEHHIAPYRQAVLASPFGPALRRHVKELQQARQTYGPVRLSKA